MRRELRWCRRSTAGELVGESSVQLLALTWDNRRVDRLGQERVAEAEAAAGLIGHEDAVLHRLAQRFTHVALGQLRDGAEHRVSDVASGGRGQTQQALRPTVEAGDALQQQVAQASRERAVEVACGGDELFGEEGIAFGRGRRSCRSAQAAGSVGPGSEQRRHRLVLEWAELDHAAATPSA